MYSEGNENANGEGKMASVTLSCWHFILTAPSDSHILHRVFEKVWTLSSVFLVAERERTLRCVDVLLKGLTSECSIKHVKKNSLCLCYL